MSDDRYITLPVEHQELKTACGQLVSTYGGQVAAGERIQRPQQHVSACCHKRRDKWLRIDEVATLESETLGHEGHPHVTALLARRAGFELVPTPTIAATGRDLLMLFAEQSKRSGKLAETVLAAHADGNIDQDEAARIEQATNQVIAAALAMRAEVRMIQREARQ
ncbi:phage regulatory CII family protein [Sphingopyxis sp. J-6]|uniref:phage regulatory CII family protein n=1 Tax=Sphingopyxis sp. J-6 TaxID=3122054 RepID=UPI00398423DD